MATIRPFKAVRATPDKVQLLVSNSMNTYKRKIRNAILESNPFSFMHIIDPEHHHQIKTKPNSPERFLRVKHKFEEFQALGILTQDEQPGFYIYRQENLGKVSVGIIAATSLKDYKDGHIKIHENTLSQREILFRDYLKVCDFNAEPVLLTYPDDSNTEALLNQIMTSESPVYNFTTTDWINHQLWQVTDEANVKAIEEAFDKIPDFYIADGHHRTASSALLAEELGNNSEKPDNRYDYFMTYIVPESGLKIYDFNRVVKDLNGMSPAEFMNVLGENFTILEQDDIFKPESIHEFSMYLEGTWYRLKPNESLIDHSNPIGELDPQILTIHVLTPILGIQDLRKSKRIRFVPGIEGMEGVQKEVDSGKAAVGFGLYPISMDAVRDISDHHYIMPPKSTWIEPKLRSGLTIYSLSSS